MTTFPDGFEAGMRLTPARLNARNTHVVEQGTTQTINDTDTYEDTNLAFVGEADAVYEYRVLASTRSEGTADLKFAWDVPSGTTSNRFTWSSGLGATDPGGGSSSIDRVSMHMPANPTSDGFAGGIGNTTSVGYHEEGIFTIGGTSGTLTLQFAQRTAEASDASFRAFSRLIYRRIG